MVFPHLDAHASAGLTVGDRVELLQDHVAAGGHHQPFPAVRVGEAAAADVDGACPPTGIVPIFRVLPAAQVHAFGAIAADGNTRERDVAVAGGGNAQPGG